MRIISWNVNGFRAILKKGFANFLDREHPEIFCLQETKVCQDQLGENFKIEGYHHIFNSAQKKGYSGTAIFSKEKPLNTLLGMNVSEHDSEGRLITYEFADFYLVTVYVPNSQRDLLRLGYRLKWDVDLRAYLMQLDTKKPVVVCGDLNVAHQEIDIANPKTNKNNPGFTIQERESFTKLLESGFTDTFRYFCKQPHRYTWWSNFGNARAKNVGWRLDYFCASNRLMPRVEDSRILADVHGSDHCPVLIEVKE